MAVKWEYLAIVTYIKMDAILNVIAILIILALPYVIYSFIKGGNESEEKRLEVFAVPTHRLLSIWTVIHGLDAFERQGLHRRLVDGEIREVRLHNLGYVGGDTWPGGEKVYLGDSIEFTICSREVQSVELAELKAKREEALSGPRAKAIRGEISWIEATNLQRNIVSNLDFQTFWFEAEDIIANHLGRSPRVGEKITKVELTNDGVEFTTVRV